MSEQREALAEALWQADRWVGDPEEWAGLSEPVRDEYRPTAQALLDSDALAQMLAEAFRKGREMGVTNANVNAERDGYRRGRDEVAAAVEAVVRDYWGYVPESIRAALTNGAADRVRTEVKAAVEEWFTNISLDDLFAVKGWTVLAEEGGHE